MYHLDPVKDAERAIEKMAKEAEEAAEIARDIEIRIRSEAAFLTHVMIDVLEHDSPHTEVPTPGSVYKTQPVGELLLFLADSEEAEKLFQLIQDAAKGKKVQEQAEILQGMFAEGYGYVYAAASLKSKGQL